MQNVIFSKGSCVLKSIAFYNARLSPFVCHFTDAISFCSLYSEIQALLLIENNVVPKIWNHNSYVSDSCGIQSRVGRLLLSLEK